MTMPILLPYQRRWVMDRSPVKVCVKSRRIGITWATAYEAVEVAGLPQSEGGKNFWYQVYSEEDAKEFVVDCERWVRAVGAICQTTTEVYDDEHANALFLLPEGRRSVQVTTIRFRSGHRITALAATPRKLRGKGGVYCLDEADSHDNLQAAIEAANPFRLWGGRIMFISTQGEVDGAWNRLVQDIKAGREGDPRANYSLHEITLPEAVAEGFYRRVCEKNGWIWTPEGEKAYLEEALAEEGAECEYLCVPRRSGGQYLPRALVEPCTRPDFVVRRFIAPPDFLSRDEAERDAAIDGWCDLELAPILRKLPRDLPHYLGEDFGRSSDMTSIAIGHLTKQMDLHVPLMLELGNVPYESQKRVLLYVAHALPRLSRMVLDATGNGAYLAEQALDRWGEQIVEAVHMSEKWYGTHLPKLRARFQDGTIAVPRDLDVIQDLGKFEVVQGVPRLPKQRQTTKATSSSGRSLKRHGDAGVALACLSAAASAPAMAYRYEATAKRTGERAVEGLL